MKAPTNGWLYYAWVGLTVQLLSLLVPFVRVDGVQIALWQVTWFACFFGALTLISIWLTARRRPGALWLTAPLCFIVAATWLISLGEGSQQSSPYGPKETYLPGIILPFIGSILLIVGTVKGEVEGEAEKTSGEEGDHPSLPPQSKAWLLSVILPEMRATAPRAHRSPGTLTVTSDRLSFVSKSGSVVFDAPLSAIDHLKAVEPDWIHRYAGTRLWLGIEGRRYLLGFTRPIGMFDELADLIESTGLFFAHHMIFHFGAIGGLLLGGIWEKIEQQSHTMKERRRKILEERRSTMGIVKGWYAALSGTSYQPGELPHEKRSLKKIVFVLALLGAAFVVFNFLLHNIEYRHHVAKADALLGQRKFAEAAVEARKAIALYNDRASAHIVLGAALAEQGRDDDAIPEYRRAIELDPNSVTAHHLLAQALQRNDRDLAGSVAEYEIVQKLDPNDKSVQDELNDVAMRDTTKKLENFNKRFADEPGITQAPRGSLAGCLNQTVVDPAVVISFCSRDISSGQLTRSQLAAAFDKRGNAYTDTRHYENGIQDFDQAIRLNPNVADVFNDRGKAYGEKGELDRAIQDFTQAIRLDPRFVEAYRNRGLAYNRKGRSDIAFQDYRQADRLRSNTNSRNGTAPKAPAGCCCQPGESAMDCLRRCNTSALPCR